jgi:hypothetical protein
VNEILERKAVTAPVETVLEQETQKVLARARNVIGYSPITPDDAAVRLRKAAEVLNRLGIEPFTKRSVEKYTAAILKKLNRSLLSALARFFNGDGGLHMFAGGIVGAAVLAVSNLSAMEYATKLYHRFGVYGWIASIVSFVLGLGVVVVAIALGNQKKKEYAWRSDNLSYYHEPVPAFALSRACELREACPTAHFEVEYLSYKELHADPFMVVVLFGYRCYIDVWDEPSFEGRQVK